MPLNFGASEPKKYESIAPAPVTSQACVRQRERPARTKFAPVSIPQVARLGRLPHSNDSVGILGNIGLRIARSCAVLRTPARGHSGAPTAGIGNWPNG